MSTMATSGRSRSTTARSPTGVPGLTHDVHPGGCEQAGDALPDEDRIVRQHDAQRLDWLTRVHQAGAGPLEAKGTVPVRIVGPAGGLLTTSVPPRASTPVPRPGQAAAGAERRAPDTVVGDREDKRLPGLPRHGS